MLHGWSILGAGGGSLMCHLAWFSGSQTALPHLHSAHYLCVSICMNLLEGFARLIFQVNDRALGERLMSGMQSFSKLLKSFTIQLISLFSTLQKCKGWMQEAGIMQISQVCLWELEESALKLIGRWLSALRRIYKSSPVPCAILPCQVHAESAVVPQYNLPFHRQQSTKQDSGRELRWHPN